MRELSASSMARLEAAETEATKGILAIRAFCTISKLERPLTSRMQPESGRRSSRSAAPTTLSTALCRPMSSRRVRRFPEASKSPAA
jgi:hypothetical protein